MSIDEKIKLGLLALSAVSAVVVATHMGDSSAARPPILEIIGGGGSP
jgi:hypothetical protein